MQTLQFWSMSVSSTKCKDATNLAVIEVFSQTLTSSADPAVGAMVDLLVIVVVPKLANIAVVACGRCFTLFTVISCSLRCSTCHTQHILRLLPVELVVIRQIWGRVMTMPAWEPFLAVIALDFDIPHVMLAAKDGFRLIFSEQLI